MPKTRKIVIIGGGLAGLAATVRLADCAHQTGCAVEIHLFEVATHLGGRATSLFFRDENVLLDNAQHLTMNCCPAMVDFLRRTKLLETSWRLEEKMTFCIRQPANGTSPLRFYPFCNARFLPPSLQLLPSLWGLKFLTVGERLQLPFLLRAIQKNTPVPGLPFRDWLEELGCPDALMSRFFTPIILSAFSEQPEIVSAVLAKTVLGRMFQTPKSWHLWIPQKTLREIFDEGLMPILETLGVQVHRNQVAVRIFPNRVRLREWQSGREYDFPADAIISAVPWHQVGRIFPELERDGLFRSEIFEPRSITAVHFWTEKPLFCENHLVFPSETIQWLFRPPFGFMPETSERGGVYHQALISDSDRVLSAETASLERLVRAEMQMLFPMTTFRRFRVTRTPNAVFSPNCWMEHARPTVLTSSASVFLAGDWTCTGLPATMESAVVSGNTAASEVLHFLQNLKE